MIKNYYYFFFLCLLFICQVTFGQKITVTGVVKAPALTPPCGKSTSEDALAGANIILVGTVIGTVTDVNGRFSLVLDKPGTLQISYIGCKTITLKVDKTTDLGTITLQEAEPTVSASFYTYYPSKDGLLDEYYNLGWNSFSHITYHYHEHLENFYDGYYWDQTNLRGYTTNTIGGGNRLLGETVWADSRFLNNGQNIAPNYREFALPQALSGKIPGIEVIPDVSNPGAAPFFRIRGAKSILGSQSSLVILNGMPINTHTLTIPAQPWERTARQSRLGDLSLPLLLELDIVKGSTGAARWGSRGGQGILYGTIVDKLRYSIAHKLEFTSSVSVHTISKKIRRQKSYGQGRQGFFFQGSLTSLPGNVPDWLPNDYSWGDQISRRSGAPDVLQDDPASQGYYGYFENQNGQRQYAIAQKNDRTTYDFYDQIFAPQFGIINTITYQRKSNVLGKVVLTLEDVNQTQPIQNSRYKRTNLGLKIVNKPLRHSKKFLVSFNTLYTFGRVNQIPIEFLKGGLLAPPDFDLSIQKGTYVNPQGVSFPSRQPTFGNPLGASSFNSIENPVGSLENNQNRSKLHRFISNLQVSFQPFRLTEVNLIAGLDTYKENRQHRFAIFSVRQPIQANNHYEISQRQWFFQANISNLAHLSSRYFSLKSTLGIEWNHHLSQSFSERPQHILPQEAITFGNVGWGAFLSQKLEFKDLIFLHGTLRYDHWTTFGDGLQNGRFYPSLNMSFLLQHSSQEFIPKFFNHIRLYLGWGQAGRLPQAALGQQLLINTHLLTNQPLAPERNNETEAGIEMRFWKERLFASVNVYQNVTNDAIIPFSIPNSNNLQLVNSGRIQNKGIEFNFNGNIIRSKKFIWVLNLNYARNINQVTDLGGQTDLRLYNGGSLINQAIVGYPLGAFYGSAWQQDDQGNLELSPEGFPQRDDTRQQVHDPNPQFRLGWGSTIHYKKFELQFLFEGSYGGRIWNGTKAAMYFYGTHQDTDHTIQLSPNQAASLAIYGFPNNPQTVASRYAPQADGNYVVRGKIANFGGNNVLLDETWYQQGLPQKSSQFVEDASWTRLRELTLSYTFKGYCFWKKTSINKLRLAFTARNLFTWTRYTGFDPETFYWGQNAQLRGIDYFNPPNTKSYIFTVQITF